MLKKQTKLCRNPYRYPLTHNIVYETQVTNIR